MYKVKSKRILRKKIMSSYWKTLTYLCQELMEHKKNKNQTSKDIEDLNNMINKCDLMGNYRMSCSRIEEYTFISSKHGTFHKNWPYPGQLST